MFTIKVFENDSETAPTCTVYACQSYTVTRRNGDLFLLLEPLVDRRDQLKERDREGYIMHEPSRVVAVQHRAYVENANGKTVDRLTGSGGTHDFAGFQMAA